MDTQEIIDLLELQQQIPYLDLFRKFRDEKIELEDNEAEIISELFTDVDIFCGDPELRDEGEIDKHELQKRAQNALERLRNLASSE